MRYGARIKRAHGAYVVRGFAHLAKIVTTLVFLVTSQMNFNIITTNMVHIVTNYILVHGIHGLKSCNLRLFMATNIQHLIVVDFVHISSNKHNCIFN